MGDWGGTRKKRRKECELSATEQSSSWIFAVDLSSFSKMATEQSSCWKIATDFFNIQMYFVHFANSFFSFTQEFISATLHKSTNVSFREPETLRQGNFVDTGLGVGTATTESS